MKPTNRGMALIRGYTRPDVGLPWLQRFRGRRPQCACVLGFTATGLIPGISAAGATPGDRQVTAIADAEFLYYGPQPQPTFPLPPLQAGASPVLISRAVIADQGIPLQLFNAGLPLPPAAPHVDLGGRPACCLSQGDALEPALVEHLFHQGMAWGRKLAAACSQSYLILGECVVGGTTTALALLTGLGWSVQGKVNSSHPVCNHQQKWEVVTSGLLHLAHRGTSPDKLPPLHLAAAVGDPMQPVVAGMAIAASQTCGVMLAGGTQMLAVYALIGAIAASDSPHLQNFSRNCFRNIVIGTTRWVADDPTGDTIGLAKMLDAPLLATQMGFGKSRYHQLRAYEQGFVKEGVAAGGCAIAASLYQGWEQEALLRAIEALADQLQRLDAHKQSSDSEGR
ncbi:MAG: nicotinate mononucleotide-dependent phosphoribosyltransferase CobT [Elainellaceae cyanobacterium]